MSVKQEMISGVWWTAIQKYSGIMVQLVISAILARLISPEEFGIVAISMVLITFLSIFTDMGIAPAIVQYKNLSQHDLNHIFSITVYGGVVLSILFFFLADSISAFYHKDSLAVICKILSVNIFFNALDIVPDALVVKNQEFKFIAKRMFFLQTAGGLIAVIAAYNGLGVYSLLIAPVLSSVGVFIVNYAKYKQRFHIRVNIQPIKQLFSFSVFQFLFNFMNYFSRNVDKLIIGKYLTLTDLGYYEKSCHVMMVPLQNVTHVITPVMHPVLSILQDNKKELAEKYNRIIKLLATIGFPLGMLLFFTAEEIILIVFGNQWEKAIPTLQILSLSVPVQIVLSSTSAIFQSAGNTVRMFQTGMINTLIQVTGFVAAVLFYRTVEAFAWFWNISCVLTAMVSFSILYRLVLRSSLRRILYGMLIPAINALLVAAVLAATDALNIENMIVTLLIKVILFAVISYFVIQYFRQYDIHSLLKKYIHDYKTNTRSD
ncbi:MAG: lipopolysaccharide biosynthesis protein [Dysgonamonadaceae bacterium]|jgi:PST family polysaccharide transporter|nr:lipopolysaccharide biosynthesis protein [Dysgonamonadaceae bacterium]